MLDSDVRQGNDTFADFGATQSNRTAYLLSEKSLKKSVSSMARIDKLSCADDVMAQLDAR